MKRKPAEAPKNVGGRPPLPAGEARSVSMQVRLTPEEHERLKAAAARDEVPATEYLRRHGLAWVAVVARASRPLTERALALMVPRAQTADDVARELGVTRTQAWHAIKELRRNGRVLDLAPGLYRAAAERPPPARRKRIRRVSTRIEEVVHARLVALAEQRGETVSEALAYLLDIVPTDVVRLVRR